MVFTTSAIIANTIATILHPFAPPPKALTAEVTANPNTIFVTTANMKRNEPS